MSDKRTGKKKKKLRPIASQDTSSLITQAPIILPKKPKKPSKG